MPLVPALASSQGGGRRSNPRLWYWMMTSMVSEEIQNAKVAAARKVRKCVRSLYYKIPCKRISSRIRIYSKWQYGILPSPTTQADQMITMNTKFGNTGNAKKGLSVLPKSVAWKLKSAFAAVALEVITPKAIQRTLDPERQVPNFGMVFIFDDPHKFTMKGDMEVMMIVGLVKMMNIHKAESAPRLSPGLPPKI